MGLDAKPTIGRIAPGLTLAAGFILAARQFLLERGVWLDEASLGINIADRDAWGLLRPLDLGQAAPALYLQVLEAFSHIYGFSLSSLRLPSLLAYGASSWIFLMILRQTVRSAPAAVIGCALFAFNYMLIHYSGEMKQYMFDVLVSLLLLHLTLRIIDGRIWDLRPLALGGSMSFFLSNVTGIVLTTCFAMLATRRTSLNDRRIMRMLLLLAVSWGVSAAAYYLLFVKGHPLREFMTVYWTRTGGFPPADPTDPAFADFIGRKLELLRNAKNIFHLRDADWNRTLVVAPIVLFAVTGMRRDCHLLWILLPVPMHFLFAWARLYPFEIRTTLYLLPLTILTMTWGLDRLFHGIRLNGPTASLLTLSLCLWQGHVFFERELPIKGNEVKKAAIHVQEAAMPGQRIWVYPTAVYHVTFHQRTGELRKWRDATLSRLQPDDVDACTREVVATGPETWLLFGHVAGNEDARIRKALEQHGYSVCDSLRFYKASAYLMKRAAE